MSSPGFGRRRSVRVAALAGALPAAAVAAVIFAPPAVSASAKKADIAVTKVATTPVRSDGRAAYIVTVRNRGPAIAKAGEVSSVLGDGVTYAAGPPQTSAKGPLVTTRIGDVPAGTTVTVIINVQVDAAAARFASFAAISSVRSTTAGDPAPPQVAAPLRAGAAQPTPAPSASLLPAPAPTYGTATPTPTVTVTVTRTQAPAEARTTSQSPNTTATLAASPSGTAMPDASPSGTATPGTTLGGTPSAAASPRTDPSSSPSAATSPGTTPGADPSGSPTVTRTLYAAPPPRPVEPINPVEPVDPAQPPVLSEPEESPSLPIVRPPHDLALPPPSEQAAPDSAETPTVAPPPARTDPAAPAQPNPHAQPAPSANPPAAHPSARREPTGLAAEVRRLLPFTGLPLAMLAGSAGALLIAGILAIRTARRRRAQD